MTWPAMSIAAVLAASTPIPYEAEIDTALAETAGIYPVPKALVIAVISVESDFRPRAVSPAGAKGLMQLMPYAARRLGVADEQLFDPAQNIRGGVRLLAVILRHYDGDVISALVAYNARPRRSFTPIPRNGETPAYVWKVLAEIRRLSFSKCRFAPTQTNSITSEDARMAHAVRVSSHVRRPRLDRPAGARLAASGAH